MEYDGDAFYLTPMAGGSASGRAVVRAAHVILTPAAERTLAQTTSAQAIFDDPTNGTITLTGSTTYAMEGMIVITNTAAPSASHSYSLLFDYSGSLLSLSYNVDASVTDGSPQAAAITRSFGTSASALTVSGSSTESNEVAVFMIRGILRTDTTGTFTPQIQFDTNAPGGTSTVAVNSYLALVPIGTSTMVSVGNWS